MTRFALLAAAVLVLVPLAAAQEQAPRPEVIARNLAENVLGEGTVSAVRVTAGGRRIDIAWEAVLYRPTHTRATNREQLRGEAELATGSIMGVLKPRLIRFTMMLSGRIIARGTRSHDGGFAITYAKELDG